MKKTFFLILVIFFYTFSAFGNPNGKGLICKCIKCILENDILYKSYDLDMKELIVYFDNGAASA